MAPDCNGSADMLIYHLRARQHPDHSITLSDTQNKSAKAVQPAVQVLDSAVRQSFDKAQIVSQRSMPDAEYLEYEVPGLFGRDFME